MALLSGEKWTGCLLFDLTGKARGEVNGYAWYFQSTADSWFVEIAEDHAIKADDLPLVGYGCGGWLYECEDTALPNNEADFITYLTHNIAIVFSMFHQNKLSYLPAVSCPCSE